MEDTQTPPAGDQAETSPTSLSDALASRNATPETEAGSGSVVTDDAQGAPAAQTQETGAQPAATAETVQSSPAATAGAEEPKPPKWYRDHMAAVNRERQAEKAEIERLRAQSQPQRPAQPQSHLPDVLEDPIAYAEALQQSFGQQFQAFQLQTTLSLSERFARQQHGNEAFEECRAWLSTKPDIEAWAIQQPDPWTAAFTQYQRERLAEEIGDDPAAYRAKIEEQIRAEYEAKLQQQAAPQQTPTMRPRPPAPATDVRGAAPRDAAGRFTGPTPMSDILGSKGR